MHTAHTCHTHSSVEAVDAGPVVCDFLVSGNTVIMRPRRNLAQLLIYVRLNCCLGSAQKDLSNDICSLAHTMRCPVQPETQIGFLIGTEGGNLVRQFVAAMSYKFDRVVMQVQ